MSLLQVSTPLSSVQRLAPGVHVSQTPLVQPLAQSVVGPHCPSAPQVCCALPTHSRAPLVHTAQRSPAHPAAPHAVPAPHAPSAPHTCAWAEAQRNAPGRHSLQRPCAQPLPQLTAALQWPLSSHARALAPSAVHSLAPGLQSAQS